MPIRLALSLHAADPALRSELMPVNERYPLADVIAACEAYYERKRRMVFVEYVMLAGVNDSFAQAAQLADMLDPRNVQGQPDPVQPDRLGLHGFEPQGDRGVPRRARAPRRSAPPCASPAVARSTPHADSWRPARPLRRSTQPNPTGGGGATTATVAWATLLVRFGS